MFVAPANRMMVRDPVTKRPLPAEGADVPETMYWHRRMAVGDVVPATKPAELPAAAEEA